MSAKTSKSLSIKEAISKTLALKKKSLSPKANKSQSNKTSNLLTSLAREILSTNSKTLETSP